MASNLRVTLLHKPFDRIEAPLASLPFFSDVRPLRDTPALVDWRFNGDLSHLIEVDRLEGVQGETLMVPTQGRIMAEQLVLFGLGKREAWDPNHAEHIILNWIDKLEGLKKTKWLLSFSGLTDDFRVWRHTVRSFVNALAFRSRPMCRHLYLAESDKWVLEAKKRHMDFGEQVSLHFDLSGN